MTTPAPEATRYSPTAGMPWFVTVGSGSLRSCRAPVGAAARAFASAALHRPAKHRVRHQHPTDADRRAVLPAHSNHRRPDSLANGGIGPSVSAPVHVGSIRGCQPTAGWVMSLSPSHSATRSLHHGK